MSLLCRHPVGVFFSSCVLDVFCGESARPLVRHVAIFGGGGGTYVAEHVDNVHKKNTT